MPFVMMREALADAADTSKVDSRLRRRRGRPGGVARRLPTRLSRKNDHPRRALSRRRHNGPARSIGGRPIQDRYGRNCDRRKQAGAGTIFGASQVAKAQPDGYTLLVATSTTLAINKTLYRKLPYDPVADFAPIALVAAVPFALVVNPSLPVNSLNEFIAYAKSKPGELSYGSAGIGSPQHLGAEMLKTAAALDMKHVPYRGSVAAMSDVIAGHIPLMVVDLQPALPQIREGKLRALGVTTAVRVGSAPDIPTLAEGGLAGFELVAWQGVVTAAGVPRPIIDRLAGEIVNLMSAPETRAKLNALALEPLTGSTPDNFAAYVRSEIERWAPIVTASGATLE